MCVFLCVQAWSGICLKGKMDSMVVRSKLGGQMLGRVKTPRFDANLANTIKALRSLQEQVACWLKHAWRSHKYVRMFVGDFEVTQPKFAFRDELDEQQARLVVQKLTDASSLDVMYGEAEQDEYARSVVYKDYYVKNAGHGCADITPIESSSDFVVPEMQVFVRSNHIETLCLVGSNTRLGDLTAFPSVHTIHANDAKNLVWDVGKHELVEASVSGTANFTQLAHVPSLSDLNVWCLGKIPDLSRFQQVKALWLASKKPHRWMNIQRANLHQMTNLTNLTLSGYSFGGILPSDLGSIISLKTLHIESTAFTGMIPSEFGKLVNLERLGILGSGVSGSMPLEVLRLEKLCRITADKSVIVNNTEGWSKLTHKTHPSYVRSVVL